MIGLVISNQRGGVGKTTTAVNFAGYLAAAGRRTLLIDTDSQGSVSHAMGLKATRYLYHLVVERLPLSECITPHSQNLDVLCGNRETTVVEGALMGQIAREMALKLLLRDAEKLYDYVIIDVAPSITLLQTCAMVFAQNILIPVDMDLLSVQGAQMSAESAGMLNEVYDLDIRVAGYLPTQVNHRHTVTNLAGSALSMLAARTGVPILPEIRTDQTVHNAARARQFLFNYNPKCKAALDYLAAFPLITTALENRYVTATV
jgi:chromosome partitioning protein